LKVAVKRKKAFGAFYLFTTGSLLTEPLFCPKIGEYFIDQLEKNKEKLNILNS